MYFTIHLIGHLVSNPIRESQNEREPKQLHFLSSFKPYKGKSKFLKYSGIFLKRIVSNPIRESQNKTTKPHQTN